MLNAPDSGCDCGIVHRQTRRNCTAGSAGAAALASPGAMGAAQAACAMSGSLGWRDTTARWSTACGPSFSLHPQWAEEVGAAATTDGRSAPQIAETILGSRVQEQSRRARMS